MASVFIPVLFLIAVSAHTAYGACSRAGLVDTDCDMLPDQWETSGYDVDNNGIVDLDLPILGADPEQKDIFIEVDYSGYHVPQPLAIADVQTAFLNAPVWNPPGGSGIVLHFLSSGEDIQGVIGQETCLNGWTAFNNIKSSYLGSNTDRTSGDYIHRWQARNNATHYALSIDTQCSNPTSSGTAEIFGNDIIISLGGSGWGTDGSGHNVGSRWEQAGTITHELGHNLNLRHGGNVDVNCKPNYLSVMSYSFQFPSFVSGRPLDYSRSTLNLLNEAALNEQTGIIKSTPAGLRSVYGPPPVLLTQPLSSTNNPINWDRDSNSGETSANANVNNLGIADCNYSTISTLYGFNDWLNAYFWGTGGNFANGTSFPFSAPASFENGTLMQKRPEGNATSNTTQASTDLNMSASNSSALVVQASNSSAVSTADVLNLVPPRPTLPRCDLQDPACTIPPCNPRSPACRITPCDPSDSQCGPDGRGPAPLAAFPEGEFTIQELRDTRARMVEGIDYVIGALTESNFTIPNPPDVASIKASLHGRLIGDFDSVYVEGLSDNLDGALTKIDLIRNDLLGLGVGSGPPILSDSAWRDEIRDLIDNFAISLERQK